MISPLLWSGTPFRSETALTDLAGSMELWTRALAGVIFRSTGQSIRVQPIGTIGGREWLQTVEAMFTDAARALGITEPADLQSYDLSRSSDFSAWTWLLAQEGRRIGRAAGLP